MGLDFGKLSPQELLAAESAVLVMRSLAQAVSAAPHGKGCLQYSGMWEIYWEAKWAA